MGVKNDKHVPSLVLFDAFLLVGSLFFAIVLGLYFDVTEGDDAYDLNVAALSLGIVAFGLLIGSIFSAIGGIGGHDTLFFVSLIMTGLGLLSFFAAAMVFFYILLVEKSSYYYDQFNEKRAYWGSFSASMVTGLFVPLAVLFLRFLMGKDGGGTVVPHEPTPTVGVGDRQVPAEKELVSAEES